FPSAVDFEAKALLDDPADHQTFTRCKLDFTERVTHAPIYQLHRDLLKLRHEEAFRRQVTGGVDGSVLAPQAFALRFFTDDHAADRLLIVNLGALLKRESIADPLVAPPAGTDWALKWSSEDPAYGGCGTAELWPDEHWHIPAEAAVVLGPAEERPRDPLRRIRRRTA